MLHILHGIFTPISLIPNPSARFIRGNLACSDNVLTGVGAWYTGYMTTIQIRIDEKTKAGAKKVFKKMGLDVSSGIKMYLSRVAQDKSIPFVLRTENGYTPEQERQLIRETEYAKKHGKRYYSVDEIMQEFFPKKK